MPAPEPRDILALATDYDRTITGPDLIPHPRALYELGRARATGRKVIVVSGRDAAHLQREVGFVADALVAENGCVLVVDGEARPLRDDMPPLRDALARLDIPLEAGEHMVSADASQTEALRRALGEAGLAAHLVPNLDRVMVLPEGVDKAAGVLAALEALDVAPERCAAVGDGENDVVMLQAVGLRLAVGNAVPELKAVAHEVLEGYGGEALARWVRTRWLAQERLA